MTDLVTVAASLFFSLVLVGCLLNYRYQRRMARQGHCGKPWRVFDVDSGGAFGTRCQVCGEFGPWFDWCTRGIEKRRTDG